MYCGAPVRTVTVNRARGATWIDALASDDVADPDDDALALGRRRLVSGEVDGGDLEDVAARRQRLPADLAGPLDLAARPASGGRG